eukprot:CAMPEP_0119355988 /NCGR_PEP_ID=MMETSP1334-20130426/4739_1 /TAXON_ID=127549 /ORGANISM="Calcidiscus leptoporus, Strain RCC1130" /LENGTH=34 /DNA_ID= /DNA_START= /DNA_END= /DNA_ORIENTATION=
MPQRRNAATSMQHPQHAQQFVAQVTLPNCSFRLA